MSNQLYPEPTVGALIFNKVGRIFLMKSHKWGHKYALPGGHIEIGETMTDAVKREVKEETNLDVYDIVFVCFFEVIFDPAFWQKKHFIFFDFVCKTNDTDVVLNEEAQSYKWVTQQEAFSLPLESNTEKFLKIYFEKKAL